MGLYFAAGSVNLKQPIVKMPGFVTSRFSTEEAPTINNIYYRSIPFSLIANCSDNIKTITKINTNLCC